MIDISVHCRNSYLKRKVTCSAVYTQGQTTWLINPITATLSYLMGMKCIHLSFHALVPQTKCHLPSSLMKKVEECSTQSHLVHPPLS